MIDLTGRNDYPLKRKNERGGNTYLIPKQPSEESSFEIGLSVIKNEKNIIEIKDSDGKIFSIVLEANKDDFKFIDDLFLESSCYFPIVEENCLNLKKISNKKNIAEKEDFSKILDKKQIGSFFLLCPLRSTFFKYFKPRELGEKWNFEKPEISPERIISWNFDLLGVKVKVKNLLCLRRKTGESINFAIWPPKILANWKCYIFRCIGDKKTGFLIPISSEGEVARWQRIAENEVKSFVINGYPQCVMLTSLLLKNQINEEGVFFFKELAKEETLSGCDISVDFGTSNSSVAYYLEGQETKNLFLDLAPMLIIGKEENLNFPGFCPFSFNKRKLFFPSLLGVKREMSKALEKKEREKTTFEDLFSCDIISLYDGFEEIIFFVGKNEDWQIFANLKWEDPEEYNWRFLFLTRLLIYAFAKLAFEKHLKPKRIVFTYPISLFNKESFKKDIMDSVKLAQKFAFSENDEISIKVMDEGSAASNYWGKPPIKNFINIFIDCGGGTTDIAIQSYGDPIYVDSLLLAGRNFLKILKHPKNSFIIEVLKNLFETRTKDFEEVLNDLIYEKGEKLNVGFEPFYSIVSSLIKENGINSAVDFIIKNRDGYYYFRSISFIRHLFCYSFLQIIGLLISGKIKGKYLQIYLAGNAWNFSIFSALKTKEALLKEAKDVLSKILSSIKEKVELEISSLEYNPSYSSDDAKLLVSLGALQKIEKAIDIDEVSNKGMEEPHRTVCGINLEEFKIGETEKYTTFNWYEPWDQNHFSHKISKELEIELGIAPQIFSWNIKDISTLLPFLICSLEKDEIDEETKKYLNIFLLSYSGNLLPNNIYNKKGLTIEDITIKTPLAYFVEEVLYRRKLPNDMLIDTLFENIKSKLGVKQ